MSKKDKDRILATNRLLEILRSERDSEDVTEPGDETVDTELVKDDKEGETEVIEQEPSSEISENKDAEDETPADTDKDYLRASILSQLKSRKTTQQDLDTTKSSSDDGTSKPEQSRLSRLTEEFKEDLMLKTGPPKDFEESESSDGVLPLILTNPSLHFMKEQLKNQSGKILLVI